MSGPPSALMAQRKTTKNGTNKNKQTAKAKAEQSNADTSEAVHNAAASTRGSSVPDSTTPAIAVAASATTFQEPRQPNVYVEAMPVRRMYEQLIRVESTTSNTGGGGCAVRPQRKQQGGKRHHFSLQQNFTELPYPRGMVNNSNFCFINSILQALLFIPAFAQLAVSASCDAQARETCPTLSTFGKWALQYWKPGYTRLAVVAPALMPRVRAGPAPGSSAATSSPGSSAGPSPRRVLDGSMQQDAQEYLQMLLERVQQELVELEALYDEEDEEDAAPAAAKKISSKLANAAPQQTEEEAAAPNVKSGWTVVKGKEKLAVREHVDAQGQSQLLNSIFGGTLESHLQGKQRQRDRVSVLVEKFFCVPVDINFAAECTIEQALEHTCTTERIYDSEREKNLKKTLRLGQLPSILLLQLRRWAVSREGHLVKLDNTVHLRRTMQISKTICGDENLGNAERTYRLLSVVCHRGDAVGRGHYVTYLVSHAASPDVLKVQATGKGNEAAPVRSAPPGMSVILCNDTNISVGPAVSMEKEAIYFVVYQKMYGS